MNLLRTSRNSEQHIITCLVGNCRIFPILVVDLKHRIVIQYISLVREGSDNLVASVIAVVLQEVVPSSFGVFGRNLLVWVYLAYLSSVRIVLFDEHGDLGVRYSKRVVSQHPSDYHTIARGMQLVCILLPKPKRQDLKEIEVLPHVHVKNCITADIGSQPIVSFHYFSVSNTFQRTLEELLSYSLRIRTCRTQLPS